MTITNITYLDQFYPNNLAIFNNPSITRLYFNDYIEITQFLGSLEQDKIYVLTFDFVVSWLMFEEDSPVLNLSKPILVTKNSNPRLISNFIKDRIRLACDTYYLDDTILEMIECSDNSDKPGVIIKYNEINIF
jgi:hypothetical protein